MLLEVILRIFEGERPEKVQVVAIVLGHFEVAVDAVHRLFQKPPSSVQSKKNNKQTRPFRGDIRNQPERSESLKKELRSSGKLKRPAIVSSISQLNAAWRHQSKLKCTDLTATGPTATDPTATEPLPTHLTQPDSTQP